MKPSEIHIKSSSFGRYLKNVRLARGISLNRICRETCVGIDVLRAIEREDHKQLPAEVFVKGFIRGYARSVGADAEAAVRLYLASRRIFQEENRSETELIKSGIHFWPLLLLWLGVLLGIMILSVLTMAHFHNSDAGKEKIQSKAIDNSAVLVSPPMPASVSPPADLSTSAASQKWLLKIVTVETTWLKVFIDDQKPREYSLNPGDRLELEARSEFNLLIGNAAGVRLSLNDKGIPISGETGHVVALKLP